MRGCWFLILAVSYLVAGCASIERDDANFRLSAVSAIKYTKLNLEQIGLENDKVIKQGEDDELTIYAPVTFHKSIYYHDKVKKNILGKKDRAVVIRETELLRKYLDESYSVKETLSKELKDILLVNSFLKKLNAKENFETQYDSIQTKIGAMIKQFDKKRTEDAFKDRNSLLANMQNLEAQVTIYNVLGPARKILKEMKKKSLEGIAPVSLQKAKEVYSASEESIWNDCRDQDNLHLVGNRSLFWATRSQNITNEILRLRDLKKNEFESIVLSEEKRLFSIANALGTEDFRNLTLVDQAKALVREAQREPNREETVVD